MAKALLYIFLYALIAAITYVGLRVVLDGAALTNSLMIEAFMSGVLGGTLMYFIVDPLLQKKGDDV